MKFLFKALHCGSHRKSISMLSGTFNRNLSNNVNLEHEEKVTVPTNDDIKLAKTFINRNPRNLERFGLAHKDVGWGYAAAYRSAANEPHRNYYHRLCLERTMQHTYAALRDYYGNDVLAISTRDWSIRKHLYKSTDVMACAVLGSILVEMCIRAGISCAEWIPLTQTTSEATNAFVNAFKKTGFSINEPSEVLFIEPWRYRDIKGPLPPKIK